MTTEIDVNEDTPLAIKIAGLYKKHAENPDKAEVGSNLQQHILSVSPKETIQGSVN